MKKLTLSLLLTSLIFGTLVGCGNNSSSSSSSEENSLHGAIPYEDKLASSCQEGVILHAFNWSFNTIKENLPAIKEAGYTTVQTSPVQQPKGGGANWWSLYQPVSFSIATSSTIGNKQELKELCEEADKYGIKIICDIVFNHMATTGGLDEWGDPEVDPEVKLYEPTIYENRATMFHHITEPTGIQNTTHCYNGLPDLNTGDPYVQERALSLLKECIDVGVDGFRFDAAKHIETPSDGNCASYFWDNTLEVAKTYYTEKTGGTLYAYGEILNDCENGRKLSIYTDKYFAVTDNSYGSIINSVGTKRVGEIVDKAYGKNCDPSKLVLWAESHDTFEGGGTAPGEKRIQRTWAIAAARKDATALFFARPNEDGEMGKEGSTLWADEYVASVNRFHNRFVGAEEKLIKQGETALSIERYSENDFGAVIVDTSTKKGELDITFENLPDGDYYDSVTGNKYEVRNKQAKISFETTGVVVLTLTPCIARPSYSFSTPSTMYANEITITLKATNAEKAYYQIDNGEKVEFTDSVKVTIGKEAEAEQTTNLKVIVENGDYKKEKTMYYTKLKLVEGYVNVVNVNPTYFEDYEVYIWYWDTAGTWTKDYELRDGTLLFDATKVGATGFLLALFPKGYVITNEKAWDSNVAKQSSDIVVSKGFYDASGF